MPESATEPQTVALNAFWRIADRWHLGRDERATLLAASPRSISRWQNDQGPPDLTRDQLERISYLLGIFSGLHTVLGDTPLADEWVRRPNADFGGRTPLDRMLAGNVGDLAHVRAYVDHWNVGWWHSARRPTSSATSRCDEGVGRHDRADVLLLPTHRHHDY